MNGISMIPGSRRTPDVANIERLKVWSGLCMGAKAVLYIARLLSHLSLVGMDGLYKIGCIFLAMCDIAWTSVAQPPQIGLRHGGKKRAISCGVNTCTDPLTEDIFNK